MENDEKMVEIDVEFAQRGLFWLSIAHLLYPNEEEINVAIKRLEGCLSEEEKTPKALFSAGIHGGAESLKAVINMKDHI